MKFPEYILSLSRKLFSNFLGKDGEDGRGRARQRQILLATLMGILARLASIFTVIVTTPLAYEYLGEDRFGLWSTITSIVVFLSFADLGVGVGLMSSIATANGANDQNKVRDLISSGYAMLVCVAGSILLLLWAFYPFINWAKMFNVQTEIAASEAGPAAATFLIVFLLNIPAMVIQRIQLGLQDSHTFLVWQIISNVLTIVGTYFAISFDLGLPMLVLALTGPPLFVNILNTINSFSKKYRDIRPTMGSVNTALGKKLLALGWVFLILQSAGMFNNLIDKFIIAQMIGTHAVASYTVTERLFNIIITIIAVALVPLWPALTEALERGDIVWINRTFKNTMFISLAFTIPVAVAMIFAAPYILKFWIPSATAPGVLLLSGFAIWKIVESMTSVVITYMNGLKIFKTQLCLMVLSVVLITPMKFFFIRAVGVAGAPWSMALGMTICILIPVFVLRRNFGSTRIPVDKDSRLGRDPIG